MKTADDILSHTMNMSEKEQGKIIWMWIKQGLVNQTTFIEVLERLRND